MTHYTTGKLQKENILTSKLLLFVIFFYVLYLKAWCTIKEWFSGVCNVPKQFLKSFPQKSESLHLPFLLWLIPTLKENSNAIMNTALQCFLNTYSIYLECLGHSSRARGWSERVPTCCFSCSVRYDQARVCTAFGQMGKHRLNQGYFCIHHGDPWAVTRQRDTAIAHSC